MALQQPAQANDKSLAEINLLVNISGKQSSAVRKNRATPFVKHQYFPGDHKGFIHKSNLRPGLDYYDQQ